MQHSLKASVPEIKGTDSMLGGERKLEGRGHCQGKERGGNGAREGEAGARKPGGGVEG